MKKICIFFLLIINSYLFSSESNNQSELQVTSDITDVIYKMPLQKIKSDMNDAIQHYQNAYNQMQPLHEAIRINSLNLNHSQENLAQISYPAYTQNLIAYLQENPQCIHHETASNLSYKASDSCELLYSLNQEIDALASHIAIREKQQKPYSILSSKRDYSMLCYHAEKYKLAQIIQNDMNDYINSINQTIQHQIEFDARSKFNYNALLSQYHYYNHIAASCNSVQFKKAAIIIQSQARRLFATQHVKNIVSQKIMDEAAATTIQSYTRRFFATQHAKNLAAQKIIQKEFIEKITQDLFNEILDDVSEDMIYIEAFIAHSQYEYLREIDEAAATTIQSYTRRFFAAQHAKNLVAQKIMQKEFIEKITHDIFNEILDDVSENMIDIEACIAHNQHKHLREIDETAAIRIQASIRKYLAHLQLQKLKNKKISNQTNVIDPVLTTASIKKKNKKHGKRKVTIKEKLIDITSEEKTLLDEEIATNSTLPLPKDSQTNTAKKTSVYDFIPKKEEDGNLQTVLDLKSFLAKEKLKNILETSLNNNPTHSSSVLHQNIQNDKTNFNDKQDRYFDNLIKEFYILDDFMTKYNAFAACGTSLNLKKTLDDLAYICAEADLYKKNNIATGYKLFKSQIDEHDPLNHHNMSTCLTKWLNVVTLYDEQAITTDYKQLENEINKLQNDIKTYKEQKNKEACKATLAQIIELKKSSCELEIKNDQLQIVALLKNLHFSGGPLDLLYISDEQKEQYTQLLKQPNTGSLQNVVEIMKIKIAQFNEPYTKENILKKFLPPLEAFMQNIGIPRSEIHQLARESINFSLQQSVYNRISNTDSLKTKLAEQTNKPTDDNQILWLHEAILQNKGHKNQLTQDQILSIVKLKNQLMLLFLNTIVS